MRVLFASDGPFHRTGYSVQTDRLAREMAADGHQVFIFSPGAFFQGVTPWAENIIILGALFGDDRWGNKTIGTLIDTYKPDLILTWLDPQGMVEYGWSTAPLYIWAPIDTWPVPRQERAILNRAAKVLVPSKWGLETLGYGEYVPCGVDMQFYDIDPTARERWGAQLTPPLTDDTYLIGMVGLNTGSPDRKGYGYAFDAIKAFAEMRPEKDIRAYLHTNPAGDMGAINLHELRAEMGLDDVIYFPPPFGPIGAPPGYMKDMYNSFDVFLHTSLTEGFGLPVIEAQACGTPVVVNACTSVTELVTEGYLAQPLGEMLVSTSTRIAIPDARRLVQGLEAVYDQRGFGDRRRVRRTVERYSFDGWYERYWKPVLATVPAPIDYSAGERKLMLAAGAEARTGYVHHDREKLWPHIDIAHDLNVFPWPFEEDAYDYIEFSDCLEHLKADLPLVMDELWRMLAPGGYLYIHTALIGSWQLYKDPTHLRGFDIDAMDYFDPETRWGETYSYTDKKWRVVKKTLDGIDGLVFVLSPRKDTAPVEEPMEAVTA